MPVYHRLAQSDWIWPTAWGFGQIYPFDPLARRAHQRRRRPDDIFVIPNYRIPKRFRHLVPFWRRVRSARASRSVEYAYAVRDRLLDGDARSGV